MIVGRLYALGFLWFGRSAAGGGLRLGQGSSDSARDIGPTGFGTFVYRDEVSEQQQAADAGDREQPGGQRVSVRRLGIEKADRLVANRLIQNELQSVGVRGRLNLLHAKRHEPDSPGEGL